MISVELTKNWRQKILLLLLVINILLLFTFIWQAYQASINHIRASQEVVRDYAHMAAQQFSRNLKSNIGYWGLHDLRTQLLQNDSNSHANIDHYMNKTKQDLKPLQLKVRAGIKSIHLYNYKQLTLSTIYGNEQNYVDKNINFIDFSRIDTFKVHHPNSEKGLITWAILALNKHEFYIVEYSNQFIYDSIVFSFESSNLLPSVLSDKISNINDIKLRLKPHHGSFIFINGEQFNPYLTSTITINEDYGNLFEGYQVTVAFDETVANKLILGGVPRNQIFNLFYLIIATFFVFITTLIIYRKEQKLSKQRSQFIARVSHELRTPLTQIRMFSESLLLNRVSNKVEEDKYLNIIHRESKHLSYLVDNILTLYENENNSHSLHFEVINLSSEIRFVIDNFKSICDERQIQIQAFIDTHLQLNTDKLKFRQIMLNIVDNAIKYGPNQQIITIRAYCDDDEILISICDQGSGINKKFHKQIWQPYYRLEREDKKAINGTGIGLAITAENLKLIHANCQVKSNENSGSCFQLSFPIDISGH